MAGTDHRNDALTHVRETAQRDRQRRILQAQIDAEQRHEESKTQRELEWTTNRKMAIFRKLTLPTLGFNWLLFYAVRFIVIPIFSYSISLIKAILLIR